MQVTPSLTKGHHTAEQVIEVTSDPLGADVLVDDLPAGTTPLKVTVSRGTPREIGVTILAVVLAVPVVAFAQEPFAAAPEALAPIRLRIERPAPGWLRTTIDPIRPDREFALARPLANVQRSSYGRGFAGRHPILVGALVGFSVGAAVGAARTCGRPPDRESYCAPAALGYGALGAGLGAAIGYKLAE